MENDLYCGLLSLAIVGDNMRIMSKCLKEHPRPHTVAPSPDCLAPAERTLINFGRGTAAGHNTILTPCETLL